MDDTAPERPRLAWPVALPLILGLSVLAWLAVWRVGVLALRLLAHVVL